MKLEKPVNPNYCATVVTLDKFVDLAGCDKIKAAIIFGSQVIVSKDAQAGERGLYFGVETALSREFAGANNLFRKPEWGNVDPEAKGFFEENGRVKCVKFRGHKSEGFFIPIGALAKLWVIDYFSLQDGDTFDRLPKGDVQVEICRKYVSKRNQGRGFVGQAKRAKPEDRIVAGQFRFHYDTEKLARHLDWLHPDSIISVSDKWHGTSVIIANLLTVRKLNWLERLTCWLGVAKPQESEYGLVWSSRKVVKGVAGEAKTSLFSYYDSDVWGYWAQAIKDQIPQGYTIYAEIVGYTPTGGQIQQGYSYGCRNDSISLVGHITDNPRHGLSRLLVYRVTYTGPDGVVFELPWLQMRGWCATRGLEVVPELYWGRADGLEPKLEGDTLDGWRDEFLKHVQETWVNDGDCPYNPPGTPSEGVVVRADLPDGTCWALKCKNYRFLEAETKLLDKGVADIEEVESQGGEAKSNSYDQPASGEAKG